MVEEGRELSRSELRDLAGLLDEIRVRPWEFTGSLDNVWWDSPAFKAGITPDMQLQAVNDQKYMAAGLREAILAAEKNKAPIKLLLKRGDDFVTVSLDYHGGMRYPHLERVESTPDRLDAILAPAK